MEKSKSGLKGSFSVGQETIRWHAQSIENLFFIYHL